VKPARECRKIIDVTSFAEDDPGMPLDIADGAADGLPRRVALKAAGVTGLAAVLAGCATYGGAAPVDEGEGDDDSSGKSGGATGGTAGGALASTGEIPVGGGKVFDGKNVVVTQPVSGEFVAFSAVCTHQGCSVATVLDGTINCPCHGSKFSIKDGSVAGGPAPRPLSKVQITVEGTSIKLA
jgi:nitrite reductase/ring-hydroxylating ferredoxin subunit